MTQKMPDRTDRLPDFYGDLGVITDPHDYFDRLRKSGPVQLEPYHGTLMVTGYDEIMEVLNRTDDTFSSAVSVVGPIPPLPFVPEGEDIGAQIEAHRSEMPWSAHLSCFDGKMHKDYRSLMSGLLTYKRLKNNEQYLLGLVDRMIDRFIETGSCEAVEEFAHATATYAVSDLMGIPEEERPRLLELIGAPPSQVAGDATHKMGPDPLIFLKPIIDRLLRERRDNPCGDLMSELMQARLKDGTAPDFEVLSGLARFLFGAGQDTTARLIAMGIKVLGEDASLQQRLRDNPDRVPDFIEEILRFDAPVKTLFRLARRHTTIGGVDVPAGTIVALCAAAGSSDPAHFAEPRRVDIDRPHVRDHLAFSRGAHACLGAPLGRLEARVAIERLLARTRHIWISETHHGAEGMRTYRFEPTYAFRSLAELHIEFSQADLQCT